MSEDARTFERPSGAERAFSKVFGFLVGLGIGLSHNYVLQVQGRKTGRLYSAPVDVLDVGTRRFLVAPRGQTQWARNAAASGRVTLKKRFRSESFTVRPVADGDKPALLKAYLDRFKTTVQRYFPVPAGSPAAAFEPLAERYPVFELIPSR